MIRRDPSFCARGGNWSIQGIQNPDKQLKDYWNTINSDKDTIHANGIDIGIYTRDFENEFISLTDIARYKSDDPTAVIQNWMRNRDVIEFLGLWERFHNPDFNPLEFEGFRKQAGANAFTMSPYVFLWYPPGSKILTDTSIS